MNPPMTSNRKIEANRRNSRKSCGPRAAAGKSVASRNALRHGLASIAQRQSVPSTEFEQFARALCGNDRDPVLFAQAVKIAENEMALRAIRAQQIAAIERLREPHAAPFVRKDNTLELAKARSHESRLAEQEIAARLTILLEKYKDQMSPPITPDEKTPDWLRDTGDIVPIWLKALLQEPDYIDDQTLALARKQIEEHERDAYEAMEAAVPDLIRLERYERRTWSRQKRAIRQFIALRFYRNSRSGLVADNDNAASGPPNALHECMVDKSYHRL
jgi:hypothetical protein